MSYTNQVTAGRKVTVNVAEIPFSSQKDGYFGKSLVINPMPAQDITREIRLDKLCFDVVVNFIYGPNDVNAGQPFTNVAEGSIISPYLGNRIEYNGQRRVSIPLSNSNISTYSFKFYDRIFIVDFADSHDVFAGLTGNDVVFGYRPGLATYENGGRNITINNPTKPGAPLVFNILVYKVMACSARYRYTDENEEDVFVVPSSVVCEGSRDSVTASNGSWFLLMNYTYTFTFNVNGNIITKTALIQPSYPGSQQPLKLVFED
jgi:hypothetical protein